MKWEKIPWYRRRRTSVLSLAKKALERWRADASNRQAPVARAAHLAVAAASINTLLGATNHRRPGSLASSIDFRHWRIRESAKVLALVEPDLTDFRMATVVPNGVDPEVWPLGPGGRVSGTRAWSWSHVVHLKVWVLDVAIVRGGIGGTRMDVCLGAAGEESEGRRRWIAGKEVGESPGEEDAECLWLHF